jgi:nucleoside-diphosphate-sugar epimerase
MTTLVVGASGATGKLLVEQLLGMGQKVKVIVRSTAKIPDTWNDQNKITVISSGITDMTEAELARHLKDCQAVASCLGHNLSVRGMFGQPRRLVTHSVELLCKAIQLNAPERPVKFVLMNTTGNRNRDLAEPNPFSERLVTGLLRLLLPPHPDNEKAAEVFRTKIGQKDTFIEWVAVRPDTLINREDITGYTLSPSPVRSALFNPGKTSRINVAHFMAKLITDNDLWNEWKGRMPVIYDKDNG